MPGDTDKHAAAQQAVDILHEISTILVPHPASPFRGLLHPRRVANPNTSCQNCHLDRRTLSICISMVERGVNPEALAVSYPSWGSGPSLHCTAC